MGQQYINKNTASATHYIKQHCINNNTASTTTLHQQQHCINNNTTSTTTLHKQQTLHQQQHCINNSPTTSTTILLYQQARLLKWGGVVGGQIYQTLADAGLTGKFMAIALQLLPLKTWFSESYSFEETSAHETFHIME